MWLDMGEGLRFEAEDCVGISYMISFLDVCMDFLAPPSFSGRFVLLLVLALLWMCAKFSEEDSSWCFGSSGGWRLRTGC